MHVVKVLNYRKLLQSVRTGNKHSVLTITARECPRSNNLLARLDARRDLNVDVFDIVFEKNNPIGPLFEIRRVPTVILLEHGMPIVRISEMSDLDEFIETVKDIVTNDRNTFE